MLNHCIHKSQARNLCGLGLEHRSWSGCEKRDSMQQKRSGFWNLNKNLTWKVSVLCSSPFSPLWIDRPHCLRLKITGSWDLHECHTEFCCTVYVFHMDMLLFVPVYLSACHCIYSWDNLRNKTIHLKWLTSELIVAKDGICKSKKRKKNFTAEALYWY